MKKFSCLVLLVFAYMACVKNASAQQVTYYPNVHGAEIIMSGSSSLENPWAGGMMNPQFSNIDVNADNRQDIAVFEPVDGKLSIYISLAGGGLRYAPEYENFFPPLRNWALFVDYDFDGKADIFTYAQSGAGMDVYHNTSKNGVPAFTQVAKVLMYEDIEFDLNLYVPYSDIPAIADIDGDGDIDILSYDVLQTQVQYYKNMSMERYGKADSLDFKIADRCWGKFAESFTGNSVELGLNCGKVGKRGKKHGGSTLLAIDMDGDGDKDMLMGDIGFDNLIYLENGRIKNGGIGATLDSMISVVEQWPSAGANQAKVQLYPAAFLADIDNDGIKDLLVTPQGLNESQLKNQVLTYKNTGTNAKPNFQFIGNDFLQNTMFNGGMFSIPAMWDYNNDSLTDLVVSVMANTGTQYTSSKLVLFKNSGTENIAIFKPEDQDFAGLAALNKGGLAPAFADINGDGKTDMVLGNNDGEILFYINTGANSTGIPQFQPNNSIATIDVGQNSRPALADLDRDGLVDLLIGRMEGTIYYYKNTGTATQPAFTLVNDTFGRIRTNRNYYEYEYDDKGQKIDSTLKFEPSGFTSPAIADINGNGKWDLLTGSTYGQLIFYLDIEDKLNDSLIATKELFFNKVAQKYEARTTGFISAPAFGDLNNDNIPEILAGNYRGGVYFFSSYDVHLGFKDEISEKKTELKIYPNPAKTNLYIALPGNASVAQTGIFTLHDALGRQVMEQKITLTPGQPYNLQLPKLPRGMYFVKFSGQKHFSQKLYMR